MAISVSPQWGKDEHRVVLDVRAGVAFVALTDALAISLFALVPGVNRGVPALALGLIGAATCVGLGSLYRMAGPERNRRRQIRLIGLQGMVFAFQVVPAIDLLRSPHTASDVRGLAILTIVFFLVGIARAWQLIGARDTGLLHIVRDLAAERGARRPPGPST